MTGPAASERCPSPPQRIAGCASSVAPTQVVPDFWQPSTKKTSRRAISALASHASWYQLGSRIRIVIGRAARHSPVGAFAVLNPTGFHEPRGRGYRFVADQFAHASIVDGMILSKAKSKFFRHNRPDDLDRKLSGFDGKKLVIVEGVYSMDGDTPPLAEIVD